MPDAPLEPDQETDAIPELLAELLLHSGRLFSRPVQLNLMSRGVTSPNPSGKTAAPME